MKAVHLAEEGFKKATQSPPALIMLDVMLPDATGFQILGRLRKQAITQEIPIIMMSGTAIHTNQQGIGKGMGANDYVLKPFDVVSVGERVRKLLSKRRLLQQRKFPLRNRSPNRKWHLSRYPIQSLILSLNPKK